VRRSHTAKKGTHDKGGHILNGSVDKNGSTRGNGGLAGNEGAQGEGGSIQHRRRTH
jgi:hypothetical protein